MDEIVQNLETESTDIAIIGLAGRFPGADDVTEFWKNLRNGIETISFFRDDELEGLANNPDLRNHPHYVKAGGVLKGADEFDAEFFGVYPKEADILDPQHRIFLEEAWHALENAGYDPSTYPGWIGVFAGTGMNTYLIYNLIANREVVETVHGYQLTISNDKDFLSTRVSYKLNLHGPSVTVQSACSTSLVATHMACQSLINYQSDIALAGGVSIRFPQKQGYLYQEGGIASPDGHCRAFDEDAHGTVGGNGVGVVVLKRLADAINDGDHIVAIIKGSAVNNDGSLKVGYTAPSVDGQVEVISMAQAVANILPETVSYIETHGTGTSMGDPIEITALSQVFRSSTQKKGFCAIGSVKPNVGHLDAAAGVTSLIKTALILQNKEIPPSINYSKPNPKIDFENSPFFVNTQLRKIAENGSPTRAGVSSFGIGGTNAHIVLEEPPSKREGSASRRCKMLMLSAKNPEALQKVEHNVKTFLSENPLANLADVAYTYQVGRRVFEERTIVIGNSSKDMINALDGLEGTENRIFRESLNTPEVVFMFPGQGAQYVNMAKGLYKTEAVFQECFDQCSQILERITNVDFKKVIYPENGGPAISDMEELLRQTHITQPALFIIEYSLSKLLGSWGIHPSAAIGHSIGEYVAATLAGVFSLEDALEIIAARGKLMQSMPSGAMVSISLSENEVGPILPKGLDLAACNAENLCVVSGPHELMDAFVSRLSNESIEFRVLHTSHAFHSSMMDPILKEFRSLLAKMDLHPPKLHVISNLTGTWLTGDQAMSPDYWASHLRSTVRFSAGLSELSKNHNYLFLEVGPGRSLSVFAKSNQNINQVSSVLSTIHHPQDRREDDEFLLTSLARLWLAGVTIDWVGFYQGEKRLRVPLPTYPFEKKKYWVSPDDRSVDSSPITFQGKNNNPSEWIYLPVWKRMEHRRSNGLQIGNGKKGCWLFYIDQDSMESSLPLISLLKESSFDVVSITPGDIYEKLGVTDYQIVPFNEEDHQKVFRDLQSRGIEPEILVYCWGRTLRQGVEEDRKADFTQNFRNIIALQKSLLALQNTTKITLGILSSGVYDITGNEWLHPEQALMVGPARVFSQENPHFRSVQIDLDDENHLEKLDTRVVRNIINDLLMENPSPVIAYRSGHRWIQQFDQLVQSREIPENFRQGGIYLITGGLGRIGMVYAGYLAEKYKAKIILFDRISFPPKDKWDEILASGLESVSTRQKIQELKKIDALGAGLEIYQVDLKSIDQILLVFQKLQAAGGIHGIIHAAGFVGLASIRTISEMDAKTIDSHFEAKVYGLMNLRKALCSMPFNRGIDFILLQSSLSSVLGGLGLAAYAAGNSFMDTFAADAGRKDPYPWISVNWDGWSFPENVPGEVASLAKVQDELGVTPQEGVASLEYILGLASNTNLVVSTISLNKRIEKWLHNETSVSQKNLVKESTTKHERPKIRSKFVPAQNELQEQLVQMWEQILGLQPIGINDDFFELGGHSLLATQIVSRMRDTFHSDVPLRLLFEQPTIAGISKIIQPDLVSNAATSQQIIPIARDQDLQLSYGQQRLWFLDQLNPQSPLYNNFAAIQLIGNLDKQILQRCIDEIVARHESLRTIFVEKNNQAIQVVQPSMDVPIVFMDLQDIPEKEREKCLQELALEEARTPFNLSVGPLFRIVLVGFAPNHFIGFFTTHHIVSDGWSVGVVINEISVLYEAFKHGEKSPLPVLPIQYADYAAWHRNTLSGEVFEKQIAYWEKQLADAPLVLDLTLDYSRPAIQTTNGANVYFSIPEVTTGKIREFCKAHGVTLFMTFMAALNVLLFRYTNQNDITIGTPIANRNRAETESLIGFLLNILVFRSKPIYNVSFLEFLEQVKETALAAYSNQDAPFEALVDVLQPQRDMSRSPLFQVMFDLQDTTNQLLRLTDLEISNLPIDTGTAKYDLALSMEDRGSAIVGYFNFNSDLFEISSIQRLCDHFLFLLNSAITSPNDFISILPIQDEVEKTKIFSEWNAHSQVELTQTTSITEMIELRSTMDPDHLAVIAEHQSITYKELIEKATKLADLILLKVSPGTTVAMLLERSVDAIVTILAIWKAGCTYLPLDPTSPFDRILFMLDDANVKLVITQREVRKQFPEKLSNRIQSLAAIVIDEPDSWEQNYQSDFENIEQEHGQAAYIIYTSGSTGKPKGVVVSHRSLTNHCRGILSHFGISSEDRVLQFSAYSFDQSLEQIVVTLMAGASLVIREQEIWLPENFSDIINKNGLSIVNLQPAYWYQWTQSFRTSSDMQLHTLRLVIIGGDAILPEHLHAWYQTGLSHVRLLNAYGPTEATITASTYEIPWAMDEEEHKKRIPIGKPLSNRKFYILDPQKNPAPIGVAGELFIGGDYLAEGYLNEPLLTKERFVKDPFSESETGLMYKTGDLARFLESGDVEFLGRIDSQVKIRGFRIELEEIESVLNSHPSVETAVVIVSSDQSEAGQPQEKRLVAMIKPHKNARITSQSDLWNWLKNRVPVYMVPSSIVLLDSIPLTPSGKVDRRKLSHFPMADLERIEQRGEYVAPRTPVEKEIVEIWQEVLKVDPVGIRDNFFELGGHSLVATQVISRIRERYRVDLPLRRLFEAPTVEALATEIAKSLVEKELEVSGEEDIEKLLAELDELSDEDIKKLLDDESE